uniref:F5/8 type C domain-containing protein n=1 Tax=Macrostomum lignano TaxID=282301 RepID=A0A1I8J762_9PLAT
VQQNLSDFELVLVQKNKLANSSSRYANSADPIHVNDGVTSAYIIHTADGDPMPWVMLDMDQPHAVFGARVWNRLDNSWHKRFTQISFGVTNNPAVWTSFNSHLFQLCFYYTDVPTVADNPIKVNCSKPIVGRYFAIYKNITGLSSSQQYINIFEIDILAMAKGASLCVSSAQSSFPAASSALLTRWSGLKSPRLDCIFKCTAQPACLFALVIPGNGDCLLFGPSGGLAGFIGGSCFRCVAVLE